MAFLSAGHAAQDGGRVSVAPERPDIVIERHDGGISIYAGDAAPGVVSMRGGADASDAGRSMAPSGPAGTEAPWDGAHQEQDQEEQQQGRQADGQEQDPRPRASAGALQPSAAPDRALTSTRPWRPAWACWACPARWATGSVVFNSKTNTWENKARRKTGCA